MSGPRSGSTQQKIMMHWEIVFAVDRQFCHRIEIGCSSSSFCSSNCWRHCMTRTIVMSNTTESVLSNNRMPKKTQFPIWNLKFNCITFKSVTNYCSKTRSELADAKSGFGRCWGAETLGIWFTCDPHPTLTLFPRFCGLKNDFGTIGIWYCTP